MGYRLIEKTIYLAGSSRCRIADGRRRDGRGAGFPACQRVKRQRMGSESTNPERGRQTADGYSTGFQPVPTAWESRTTSLIGDAGEKRLFFAARLAFWIKSCKSAREEEGEGRGKFLKVHIRTTRPFGAFVPIYRGIKLFVSKRKRNKCSVIGEGCQGDLSMPLTLRKTIFLGNCRPGGQQTEPGRG